MTRFTLTVEHGADVQGRGDLADFLRKVADNLDAQVLRRRALVNDDVITDARGRTIARWWMM